MRVGRTIRVLTAFATLTCVWQLIAVDSGAPPPTTENMPLSTDQVVDNLVRRNQERAQALLHSEATRVYRLVYHGLASNLVAEMTVPAIYERPSYKNFTVVSQSGSKLIANHVFKRLLESEKEAAQ